MNDNTQDPDPDELHHDPVPTDPVAADADESQSDTVVPKEDEK